jgi:hypothetical protein
MKLEDQICPLELAKKLKELGVSCRPRLFRFTYPGVIAS